MPPSLYGVKDESKAIWVYLEQDDGVLENVSLEMLAKGREMADLLKWKLVGLLVGKGVASLAKTAISRGADEVRIADHPLLGAIHHRCLWQGGFPGGHGWQTERVPDRCDPQRARPGWQAGGAFQDRSERRLHEFTHGQRRVDYWSVRYPVLGVGWWR